MTYAYRFDLPAARGLPQPDLSLTYSSSARDREAGFGWGLDLPLIEMRPLSGWPRYTESGTPIQARYLFEGKPLVRICVVGAAGCPFEPHTEGHPTWATGWTYYRLQVEGLFARFYQSDDFRTWRVQFKGGLRLDFGARRGDDFDPGTNESIDAGAGIEGDSQNPAIPRWSRWRLFQMIEAAHPKNFAVFKWERDSREVGILRHIYYTPPASTAPAVADFAHHVQLDWEAPSYAQSSDVYLDRATTAVRLKRVAIASKTWSATGPREVVRSYKLSYLNTRDSSYDPVLDAPLWHHSFLRSIQMEGRCEGRNEDGAGLIPPHTQCVALPAVSFEYSRGELASRTVYPVPVNNGPPDGVGRFAFPNSTAIVDFNRDGLPDVVQGWENPCTPTDNETHPAGYPPWEDLYTKIESGTNGPELWCHTDEIGNNVGIPEVYSHEYKIRSSRPVFGYINRGTSLFSSEDLSLDYQCMDTGHGPVSISGLNVGDIARFLTSRGGTNVGHWGRSVAVWQKGQYRSIVARPMDLPDYPPGSEPPNLALGGCHWTHNFDRLNFFPRWTWEEEARDFVKGGATAAPHPGAGPDDPGWVVDIDGDGFPDRLVDTDVIVATDLHLARVEYTRRFSRQDALPQRWLRTGHRSLCTGDSSDSVLRGTREAGSEA